MLRRLFLFLLCCSLSGIAQSKRPFTFEDMMQLKRVGEPVVSPDGKWVGFAAVDVNLDENTRKPHLWIVPIAGGEARRLTPSERLRRRSHPFLAGRQTHSFRVLTRWRFANLGTGFRLR